ncbi:VHS domain-containing protein [Blumeria hordei DH14]|uniref:VHS domain-containing protein n=1 Tax=Blumeria graminis f. sp. hordei (strain DH14) TaxID=546991 RepID=N1JNU4_BLUG1|nr:VHS domain-containing protein [Blumeria hordei DH14]
MFHSKPYSAVTVTIERLTDDQFDEEDVGGIPDLVEAISLQSTGPSEAARAIRKKLKYGNVTRQLRALTILDGLIHNGGPRFQRTFADEMLLERLRVCGTSDLSDPKVKSKCQILFQSWATKYKDTPGFELIVGLYKQLPRHKQILTQEKSSALRESKKCPIEDCVNDKLDTSPQLPTLAHAPDPQLQSSSSRSVASIFATPIGRKLKKENDKEKQNAKSVQLVEDKKIKCCVAEASLEVTNLLNSLKLISREHEQISENKSVVDRFEKCKLLRRRILHYIQNTQSEEWLGPLLHANDELVIALMTFEQLDRSIDADSDSDSEIINEQHLHDRNRLPMYTVKRNTDKLLESTQKVRDDDIVNQIACLKPDTKEGHLQQRPVLPQKEIAQQTHFERDAEDSDSTDCDQDNPFSDRNAMIT